MMAPGIWLGLDPSLSAFGFAVAQASHAPFFDLHFIEVGAWKTKREAADRTVTEGYARRCEVLSDALFRLRERYGRPVGIALEGLALPFGKTSLQTVSALGRVRGIVDGFARSQMIRAVEFPPQALKRAVTGSSKASKADVQRVVKANNPELIDMLACLGSDIREDASDAASAILAVLIKKGQ